MAVEVILPRVDMDMTTGRIARWYVAEGETVEKGQPLFEIETDKAAMEIEAPGSGILQDVVAAAEAAIPVGSVVAWIRSAEEAVGPVPPSIPVAALAAATAAPSSPSRPGKPSLPPPADAFEPAAKLLATPLARRLARQHNTLLHAITGSGPRGRIQARDVATAQRPVLPAEPTRARPTMTEAAPVSRSGGLHRVWLRDGPGRPLVLVHGFGAELNGWRPLVAALAPGRPVLGIDLPGHGQSSFDPHLEPSLAGLAESVAETLADEHVQAADLVGHSLGAAVATRVAETAAFAVSSLLLIAPTGLGPDIDGAFLDGFLRARSADSLAPWLQLLVADPAALGPGFVQATLRGRTEEVATAQAVIASALFPDSTQAFSIRDSLERLAMPARVVFGTADRIIPARHAQNLPGSIALHRFQNVGHMPHVEARAAVARIVDQMWAEHAGR